MRTGERKQLRTGDDVIVRSARGASDPYHGRRGVIEFMDRHAPLNVRVRFPVGGPNWFSEGELRVIEEEES